MAALMADPLLAQSAIHRLQSAAYELVLDGESAGAARNQPSAQTDEHNYAEAAPPPLIPQVRRARYGAAPPASRLLRIADATALRAGPDPGASTAP